MLLLSIVSCKTTKQIESVERVKTDTCYINQLHYDSIYITQNHYVDRSKDTVYIRDTQLKYKYKFLRDTIYNSKTDSIPIIKAVEVEKQIKYVPWYTKTLAWIGAIVLLLVTIFIIYKLTKR